MTSALTRMATTGIGFAGIEGAWWLPAAEPFRLSAAAHRKLADLGTAFFTLLETVGQLFDTPAGDRCGLTSLLLYKTPPEINRWRDRSPVLSMRPDFQIVLDDHVEGGVHFVATELEICPSAQGYAHAMQIGYSLPTDLVNTFAALLDGRELIFVGSHQWSEFLFEQLAFCCALAEQGAQARVLFDRPLAEIAADVLEGRRWQPPIFGVQTKPPDWNPDVLGRLRRSGLDAFLLPDGNGWPASVGAAVLFRFGYLDCFDMQRLEQMADWQRHGATFLNPLSFIFDSKVVMATLALADVRHRVEARTPGALAILDRSIPETVLLTDETIPRLMAEQEKWVIKFAGFDRGNQAWGGRSLRVGAQHTRSEWANLLVSASMLAWPVVAQRITPSFKTDIDYWDRGKRRRLEKGTTRLRVFFMRTESNAAPCGAHITVSGKTMQVSEATDAVQAPVVWSETAINKL